MGMAGSVFLEFLDEPEHEERERGHQDEEDRERDVPVFALHVAAEEPGELAHAEDTGEEGRDGDRDHDGVHVLHQHVQVVVDDVGTRVDESGENLGVDLRLVEELPVFDLEIVEWFFQWSCMDVRVGL